MIQKMKNFLGKNYFKFGLFIILVIILFFSIRNYQENQRITRRCVKLAIKNYDLMQDRSNYVKNCIKVIKYAGSVEKFKKIYQEIEKERAEKVKDFTPPAPEPPYEAVPSPPIE